MGRCSLESEYSLNGFLSENGMAQSVSNVGELLCFSPLHIILSPLIVIIVMSFGSVLESCLEINLLSL